MASEERTQPMIEDYWWLVIPAKLIFLSWIWSKVKADISERERHDQAVKATPEWQAQRREEIIAQAQRRMAKKRR